MSSKEANFHYNLFRLCLDVRGCMQVQRSLYDLPLLFTLMRVAEALLANPHVYIEGYVSDSLHYPTTFAFPKAESQLDT
jgi:hypothetical protein